MWDDLQQIIEKMPEVTPIFRGRSPLKGGRITLVEKTAKKPEIVPELAASSPVQPQKELRTEQPHAATSVTTPERTRFGGRNGKPVVLTKDDPSPPESKSRFGRRF